MAQLRRCYRFKARLKPGGPLVTCQWYWCDENAPIYDKRHAFPGYSQMLQCKNRSNLSGNVGEVTRPQEGDGNWFPNHENRYRPRWGQPYDKGIPPVGVGDGSEGPHGTENAYQCKPESDGSYWAKVWTPASITPEEFAALPDCIRERWEGMLEECEPWEWSFGDPMEWEEGDPQHISHCDECEPWEWSSGDPMEWEEGDPQHFGPCEDCEPWEWSSGDSHTWDESEEMELYCPE